VLAGALPALLRRQDVAMDTIDTRSVQCIIRHGAADAERPCEQLGPARPTERPFVLPADANARAASSRQRHTIRRTCCSPAGRRLRHFQLRSIVRLRVDTKPVGRSLIELSDESGHRSAIAHRVSGSYRRTAPARVRSG